MRRVGMAITALAALTLAACADGATEARDNAAAAFARRPRPDSLRPPHDTVPRPPHDTVPRPPHDSVPPPPPDTVPPPPDTVPPPPPPDSVTAGDLTALLR